MITENNTAKQRHIHRKEMLAEWYDVTRPALQQKHQQQLERRLTFGFAEVTHLNEQTTAGLQVELKHRAKLPYMQYTVWASKRRITASVLQVEISEWCSIAELTEHHVLQAVRRITSHYIASSAAEAANAKNIAAEKI